MGKYTIWTLDEHDLPMKTFPYRSNDLEMLREYLKGYRANNPKKAYWLIEKETGIMLPY